MGTMGEVSTDYRDPDDDQWMEQQSSARLFERSRIKVLAGSLKFELKLLLLSAMFFNHECKNDLSTLKLSASLLMISIWTCM